MAHYWIDRNCNVKGAKGIAWTECNEEVYREHRDRGYNCAQMSGGEFPVYLNLKRVNAEELLVLTKLMMEAP